MSGASSGGSRKAQLSTGAIAGIAIAGGLLVIALIVMVLFALRQKRKIMEVTGRTDPFGKDLKTCAFQCMLCLLLSVLCECERFNAEAFRKLPWFSLLVPFFYMSQFTNSSNLNEL